MSETTGHMLFICDYKADVWSSVLADHLARSPIIELSSLYRRMSFLTLARFHIVSDDRLSIFDILGSIMHAIWVTHWNDHFRRAPFTPSVACNMVKKIL
jgi:hypothetical protein